MLSADPDTGAHAHIDTAPVSENPYPPAFNVRLCTDVFDYLCLAALIDDEVLCVHGGLSPALTSLDEVRSTIFAGHLWSRDTIHETRHAYAEVRVDVETTIDIRMHAGICRREQKVGQSRTPSHREA